MKNVKGFICGLVLGLGLALSGVGVAQTVTQSDQTTKAKAESCCAMESCCGQGGCCSMQHQGADHASKAQTKQTGQHSCCCCGGDSCQLNMKSKENKQKQ